MRERPAFPVFATFVLAACVSSGAWAQSGTQVVQQVLDRVAVFNGGTALEMNFEGKPYKEPTANEPSPAVLDFFNYNLVESSRLGNCRLNGSRGLYCVDGQSVRRWQDPADGGPGQVEFSCANEALRLDRNRTDICTALAVAQNGDVWVAGRRKSASVLIRLRQKLNGSCRDAAEQSLSPAATERYCYLEYTTSERPLISRLLVIDGDEGEVFDRGNGVPAAGVLALDVRNVVTYYSMVPKATPIDLVQKADWMLLDNKEVLQDLALLQTPNGEDSGDTTDNRVLVTTSRGRVLSRQTDADAPLPLVTDEVFDVAVERIEGSVTCPVAAAAPAGYGVTVSAKTGRVYVTDRSYCQVLALDPFDSNSSAPGIQFGGLVNVKDTSVEGGPDDLTLSTSNSSVPSGYDGDTVNITGEYPPDGATVAPGIVVDLQECKGTCKVIASADADLLTLTAVQLNSAQSSIVLFQVRNIPDCRYRLNENPDDELCADYRDAVVGPAGDPGQQYLDVARMLPPEVTAQFPSTDALPPGLPPLLISPQYRGRADKGYVFGAVFAIPEPGVVFKETFEADFDVAGLTDSELELGCTVTDYPGTTVLQDLLRWDVVTRVSERYIAPGGPNGLARTVPDPVSGSPVPNKLRYVDTIVNSGCGTTKTKIGSFSLIAYGLEIAHNPTDADDQDDVFARLVLKLFGDLKLTQTQLSCPSDVDRVADGTTPASDPLTDAQCSTLNSVLLNAEDKLNKCVAATRQPKTSAVDQNCQAFETQFSSYRAQLGAVTAAPVPAGAVTLDPANRIGELKARAETLWLVYDERFLPSVPLGGYTPLSQ